MMNTVHWISGKASIAESTKLCRKDFSHYIFNNFWTVENRYDDRNGQSDVHSPDVHSPDREIVDIGWLVTYGFHFWANIATCKLTKG